MYLSVTILSFLFSISTRKLPVLEVPASTVTLQRLNSLQIVTPQTQNGSDDSLGYTFILHNQSVARLRLRAGAGAGTGAGSIQEYMSPYQTQVIDASLAEFDRNAAANRQRIRDQAVASGAFGGGREGVELAEYQTGSDQDRLMLQANLLQQGFGQAQAARQQDIANRFGLAQATQGLGAFQSGLAGQQAQFGQGLQSLQGTDISRLGQLGALNQAQAQAQLDAQREAARQATFLPQEQLDRFAGQVTGIMGGYPGQTQTTNIPNPTPLQTALGVGSTLAGIYGGLTTGNPDFFKLGRR